MVLGYEIANCLGAGVKKIAQKVQAELIVTDSQLLERAKTGDQAAFGELVKRHQNFVYKTAYGYLNNGEQAKDVVQEVFIKAYQGLPYFQSQSQFSTWLYKICKNHCLNIIRRRKLESGKEQAEKYTVDSDIDIALSINMKKLIACLNDEFREIIILRYYNDLTYDEISQYLDLPISSVKIRLYRAKQELKQLAGVNIK